MDFKVVGWAKIKADQFQTTRAVSGSASRKKPLSAGTVQGAPENSSVRSDFKDETLSLDYVPNIDSCKVLKNIGRGYNDQVIGKLLIHI